MLRARLLGLVGLLLVGLAAGRAAGQAADIRLLPPGPTDWTPIGPLTPYDAIRSTGPIVDDPSGLGFCDILKQLGLPELGFPPEEQVEGGPIVLRLSFEDPFDPGACPIPDVVGSAEIFVPPQLPGDYELRYSQGGLDIVVPFAIVDLAASPLAGQAGRLSSDPAGFERQDVATTLVAGDLAWIRSDLANAELRAQFADSDFRQTIPGSDTVDVNVSTPQVASNHRVVWDGVDVNAQPLQSDFDVLVYDRSDDATCNVTDLREPGGCDEAEDADDERSDEAPQVSGTTAVWQSGELLPGGTPAEREASLEIFVADLAVPLDQIAATNLTNDPAGAPQADQRPRIDGDFVVWQRRDTDADGGDFEIFFADLSAPSPAPQRLTDDPQGAEVPDDLEPRISGPLVVWKRRDAAADGGDLEIFAADLRDAAPIPIHRITDNDYADDNPFVSGQSLVWEASIPDTLHAFAPVDDSEIQFASLAPPLAGATCGPPPFPGPGCVTLTDNEAADVNPLVRGTRVLWDGIGGNGALIQALTVADATAGGPPLRLSEGAVSPGTLVASGSAADVPHLAWSEAFDDEPAEEGDPDPVLNLELKTVPAIPTPEPAAVAGRLAALVVLASLAARRARAGRR